MDKNQQFLQGLNAIRNKAAIKRGTVSVADILAAFPGTELNDAQVALIYDYLERENITLEDYEPHDVNTVGLDDLAEEAWGGADSEREQRIFEMYQDDLASVPPISTAEDEELRRVLLEGDAEESRRAAERLTEGNLRWVVQIARGYAGRGVPLPDLIQEGNLALWECIQGYGGDGDLTALVEKAIHKSMKDLIREAGSFEKMEDQMAAMANRIMETVKAWEEENGRSATAAEISARTGIPESKVEEVLRESAKAIRNEEH